MKEQGRFPKFCKIFGLLYVGFNSVIFAVLGIMIIYTAGKYLQFSPPWIFFIIPVIGIMSGYWIRNRKFGWWRILIIAFSLLCSLVLCLIFVSGSQMEEMKQEKFKKWQKATQENTQQMFGGVYSDDINIIRSQLDKGVEVNALNETKQTALHVTQNKDIAQMLIDRGANINAKDDMEMTPIFNKEIDIAGILLDAGADINARSERGNTLFIWYTYSGYLEGVHFLISKGADINVCNADNQNAVDIAQHFHPQTDILKYLQTLNIQNCIE